MQTGSFENMSSDALRYAKGEEMLSKIALVGRSLFVWTVIFGSLDQTVY